MEYERSKLKFKSIKGELSTEERKHYEELNKRIKGQFHISTEGKVELNLEDEIVAGSLITHNGEVVHERTKEAMKA